MYAHAYPLKRSLQIRVVGLYVCWCALVATACRRVWDCVRWDGKLGLLRHLLFCWLQSLWVGQFDMVEAQVLAREHECALGRNEILMEVVSLHGCGEVAHFGCVERKGVASR